MHCLTCHSRPYCLNAVVHYLDRIITDSNWLNIRARRWSPELVDGPLITDIKKFKNHIGMLRGHFVIK